MSSKVTFVRSLILLTALVITGCNTSGSEAADHKAEAETEGSMKTEAVRASAELEKSEKQLVGTIAGDWVKKSLSDQAPKQIDVGGMNVSDPLHFISVMSASGLLLGGKIKMKDDDGAGHYSISYNSYSSQNDALTISGPHELTLSIGKDSPTGYQVGQFKYVKKP